MRLGHAADAGQPPHRPILMAGGVPPVPGGQQPAEQRGILAGGGSGHGPSTNWPRRGSQPTLAIFRSGRKLDKEAVMTATAAFAIPSPTVPSAAARYYRFAVE